MSRLTLALFVAATVGVGALLSAQARLTAELAVRFGSPYMAAGLTIAVGTALLSLSLLFSARARSGLVAAAAGVRTGQLPPWGLLAGVTGAFFVAAQGVTAGPLGLAVFAMSVVSGQVVAGLLFDSVGLAGTGRTRPTLLRVSGSLATLLAVGWSALSQGPVRVDPLLAAVAFLAGAATAFGSAANGRVQSVSHNPASSSFINHALGLVTITPILLWLAPWGGHGLPSEPWLYLGGAFGALGIAVTSALVRVLGILLLGLGMVAGQLIGALLIDILAPASGGALQTSTVVAVILTFGAVALTYLDASRSHAGLPRQYAYRG